MLIEQYYSRLRNQHLPIFIITIPFFIFSLAFFIYRRHAPAVKARGIWLTTSFSLSAFIFTVGTFADVSQLTATPTRSKGACQASFWLSNLFVPVLILTFLARSLRLVVLYHSSLARAAAVRTRQDRIWLWLSKHKWASERRLSMYAWASMIPSLIICAIMYRWSAMYFIIGPGICYFPPNRLWIYTLALAYPALLVVTSPIIVHFGLKSRDIHGIFSLLRMLLTRHEN